MFLIRDDLNKCLALCLGRGENGQMCSSTGKGWDRHRIVFVLTGSTYIPSMMCC
uniref:Uncharacterized protein n=1 Tax=Anguilla anguilla TaxID=7936 RepID=A0A0E9WBF6_ANGAN